MEDLVGVAEIAERLNLTAPGRVRDLIHRHDDFPDPVKKLRMGNLYLWPAVEKWAREHNRLPEPADS